MATLGTVRKGMYKKHVGQPLTGAIFAMAEQLTTLDGFPLTVDGDVIVSQNKITSFEGSLKEVTGSFNISRNELTSLKEFPKVGKSVNLSHCGLTTLQYMQEEINGSLDLEGNELSSLEYIKFVEGVINLRNNKFISKESIIEEIIDKKIILKGSIRTDFGTFLFDVNKHINQQKMGKFKDLLKFKEK